MLQTLGPETLEDEIPSRLNSATEECRPIKKVKWTHFLQRCHKIQIGLTHFRSVHHHWAYILTERKWSDSHSMTWFLSWEEILLPRLTTCGKKRPHYRKCSCCGGRLVPWRNDWNRKYHSCATQSPVSCPACQGDSMLTPLHLVKCLNKSTARP